MTDEKITHINDKAAVSLYNRISAAISETSEAFERPLTYAEIIGVLQMISIDLNQRCNGK